MPQGNTMTTTVAPISQGQRCGNCRFWYQPAANEPRGNCRNAPPAVFPIVTLQPITLPSGSSIMGTGAAFQSVFPPVEEHGWCGKWERRHGESA